MGSYEILDQVVDLLRHRGRVTYRALKREFQVDDAFLEDLKAEIISAQRLAFDEQGAVLVWVGEAGTPLAPQEDAHSPQGGRASMNTGTLRPNAASSPCCFVTWWIRPYLPANSTRKSCARWCGPIKRPALR